MNSYSWVEAQKGLERELESLAQFGAFTKASLGGILEEPHAQITGTPVVLKKKGLQMYARVAAQGFDFLRKRKGVFSPQNQARRG